MTKWFYRAVGTVGVAGGFLLLAGAAAHADGVDASPVTDLQGSLDELFTPLGSLDRTLGPVTSTKDAPAPTTKDVAPATSLDGVVPSLGDVTPTTGGLTGSAQGFLAALPTDPAATLGQGGQLSGVINDDGLAGSSAPQTLPAPAPAPASTPASASAPAQDAHGAQATQPTEAGGLDLSPVAAFDAGSLGLGDLDAGKLLPATIGDSLSQQNPELFLRNLTEAGNTSLPLVGDLDLPAVGGPPGSGSSSGGSAGSPLAGLPLLDALGSFGGSPSGGAAPAAPASDTPAAPAASDTPAATDAPTSGARQPGKHRAMSQSANERPIAGEDADFA